MKASLNNRVQPNWYLAIWMLSPQQRLWQWTKFKAWELIFQSKCAVKSPFTLWCWLLYIVCFRAKPSKEETLKKRSTDRTAAWVFQCCVFSRFIHAYMPTTLACHSAARCILTLRWACPGTSMFRFATFCEHGFICVYIVTSINQAVRIHTEK